MSVAIRCSGCGRVVLPSDQPPPGPDHVEPEPDPFDGGSLPPDSPMWNGVCPRCHRPDHPSPAEADDDEDHPTPSNHDGSRSVLRLDAVYGRRGSASRSR